MRSATCSSFVTTTRVLYSCFVVLLSFYAGPTMAIPFNVTTPWCGNGNSGTCTGSTYANVFEQLVVADRYLFVTTIFTHKVTRYDSLTDTFTTFVGSGVAGNAEGTGTAAKLWGALGLTVSRDGIYLFVGRACGVSRVELGTATLAFLAGHASQAGYLNGFGHDARFGYLLPGLEMESTDMVVADRDNHVLRWVTPGTAGWGGAPEQRVALNMAGLGNTPGWVDGFRYDARFNKPTLLRRVNGFGIQNLYVFESGNQAIRRVNGYSDVTTVHSVGFEAAIEVSVDENTVWYASETAVYMLNPATGTSRVVAGSASAGGFSDGVGSAARFSSLWSMRRFKKGGTTETLLLGANGRIREMTLA